MYVRLILMTKVYIPVCKRRECVSSCYELLVASGSSKQSEVESQVSSCYGSGQLMTMFECMKSKCSVSEM